MVIWENRLFNGGKKETPVASPISVQSSQDNWEGHQGWSASSIASGTLERSINERIKSIFAQETTLACNA